MDRVAIVTGGTRGIGRAIVYEFCRKNIKVVLNYKNSDSIANEIKKELGDKVEVFKADISNREDVKKLVEFTLEKFGTIDILVNNAGIAQNRKLFSEITDEDWDIMMKTNLTSNFYTIQEVLPTMIHNKSGCIINISSIWGMVGASCEVHYAVSKAGVNGLTKSLAKELGPSNIRVNAIAPGLIDTDMNHDLLEDDWERIIEDTPLQKKGYPKDIAKCASWLVDDEFTTGQIISPNGGWVIT